MANSPVDIISKNPEGSIFNLAFLQGAAERAVKTGVQFALGIVLLSVTELGNGSATLNAFELDWELLAGTFLGGVILSLGTSVVNPEFVAGKLEIVRPPQSAGGADSPLQAGVIPAPASRPVDDSVLPPAGVPDVGGSTRA